MFSKIICLLFNNICFNLFICKQTYTPTNFIVHIQNKNIQSAHCDRLHVTINKVTYVYITKYIYNNVANKSDGDKSNLTVIHLLF